MFRISPEALAASLQGIADGKPENVIRVDDETRRWALLSLDRMSRILDADPADNTITVEAGSFLGTFQEQPHAVALGNAIQPAGTIRHRQRLLVVIDTSGSIGQDDLTLFFNEIFHLWRAGAQVDVLESDTKVYRQYAYRGATPELITGRGGTNFNDALEQANRQHPDGLIFFTDGFADKPRVQMRMPVLWVITRRGLEPKQLAWAELPGRKVKM